MPPENGRGRKWWLPSKKRENGIYLLERGGGRRRNAECRRDWMSSGGFVSLCLLMQSGVTMAPLIGVLSAVMLLSRSILAAPTGVGSSSHRNITVFVGEQIEMLCNLKSSPDVKLIWMNLDRQVMLAVNHFIITEDARITTNENNGSWSLVIDNVRRSDAGTYRCQINTGPHLISDINLQVQGCQTDEFACADRCIPLLQRCDGLIHCVDGEDEERCVSEAVDCPAGEFPCGDGECVPLHSQCDGRRDCENGADERPEGCQAAAANATIRTSDCDAASSDCGDGRCVPASWWCDGELDCDNAADEDRCSARDCQPETTYCGDGRCAKGGRCDGKDDCGGGDGDDLGFDERDCSGTECFPGARYCGNGRCAASYMLCDGIDQCGNGADEQFCDPLPQHQLPATMEAAPLTTGGVWGRVTVHQDPPTTAVAPLTTSGASGGRAALGESDRRLEELVHIANQTLSLQRAIAALMWRSCREQWEDNKSQFGRLTKGDFYVWTAMGSFPCADDPADADDVKGSVPMKQRCDGQDDCPNGRDEKGCHATLLETCGPDPSQML